MKDNLTWLIINLLIELLIDWVKLKLKNKLSPKMIQINFSWKLKLQDKFMDVLMSWFCTLNSFIARLSSFKLISVIHFVSILKYNFLNQNLEYYSHWIFGSSYTMELGLSYLCFLDWILMLPSISVLLFRFWIELVLLFDCVIFFYALSIRNF